MKCLICNSGFNPRAKKSRTCSQKCCNKLHYQEHKIQRIEWQKEYYLHHKKQQLINAHRWQSKMRLKILERIRERKATDPNYLIKCRLKRALCLAFERYTETGKLYSGKDYGIDWVACVKVLLPLPFPIENRKAWHIDHVIPLSKFDLTKPEETKRAFSPMNLQWLRAEDNLKKGIKIMGAIKTKEMKTG